MPALVMPDSNALRGRLRVSEGKATSTNGINGKGGNSNGGWQPDFESPSTERTTDMIEHTLESDEDRLVQMLLNLQHKGVTLDSKKGLAALQGLLQHILSDVSHNVKSIDDGRPGSKQSDLMTKPSMAAKQPMLFTSLGAALTQSSDEPLAMVDHIPRLPTAELLKTTVAPKIAARNTTVTAFDAVAPKFQGHASVWQATIEAARSGDALVVNGKPLGNPSLVMNDTEDNPVRVPLAMAIDAKSATLPPSSRVKRAFVGLPTTSTVSAIGPAVIPPILLKENLSGHETVTVPSGFVLAGDVKLFGSIEAQRYTYHGTAGSDQKAEMAIINKSPIAMNDLLPNQGFSFGDITLQSPRITVYADKSSTGRDIGLWLDADLSLDGDMSGIASTLHDVSGKTVPSVTISVHLGGYQSLSDALKVPSDLLLRATLSDNSIKIGEFLELTSTAIEIHGTRATSPSTGYSWSASLAGDALVTVPGSVAPLATNYTIAKSQSTYNLALKLVQDEWDNAMGVPGFHLRSTVITSSFTTGTKDSGFTFDIKASLALGTTIIDVTGHYSSEGWDFHATVGVFTLAELESAFATLFKADLAKLDHEVSFSDLALDITSKDKTLSFHGSVSVDKYTSAKAVLTIGPTGVHLTGDMDKVTFDKVTISNAHMEFLITKTGLIDPDPAKPGTAAAFNIHGEIQVGSNVTFAAEASFAKDAKSSAVWVIYARAQATGGLSLSKFVSVPADLIPKLDEVIVMASNTDNAALFPAKGFTYTVKQGFSLLATIDCPKELTKALRLPDSKMTLEIDLAATAKEVTLDFAAAQQLTLKPGMVAPSVKVGIMLTDVPTLFVAGDMSVQLKGQPTPLVFELRLSVGPTEAQCTAALMTNWVNPFDISPKVEILAPVTLGVIIDYAAATYPSGLSFQGGLKIGDTLLHAAFEVGENPQDGVLLVHAENLGIRDIVSFVSLVIDGKGPLPMPASDFLFFKDLALGISSGGTIGSTFYPPGATFNADLLMFGKEIKVHCAVDKALPGFALHAEFDTFQLGPLTVAGNTTKNPTLDLQFGTQLQHALIDGKITLFDSDIAATIRVDLVPLAVTFAAELKFSDLLLFQIQAHAAGEIKSIKDVIKADFTILADLEQKLLDYMMALANTYIATAKKASDEGINSAKAKLDQTQKAYDEHIAQCQRDLNDAKAKFDKKTADVQAVANAQIAKIRADEQTKRDAIDQAQKAFNAKIDRLTQTLNQTQINAANSVRAAQTTLDNANKYATNQINSASSKLADAQRNLTNSFGNANNAINAAQGRVNDAQNNVNNLQNQYNGLSRFDPRRISVGAEIGVATAALATARGVLTAAQAVLNTAAYKVASEAVTTANGALDAAKSAANASIYAASRSLDAAKTAANLSVSAAQSALDAAKQGCDELNVLNIAKGALDAYVKTEAGLLSAANTLLQGLANCAERIAFDAANAAMAVAKSATKELDAAKSILSEVQKAADEFFSFGQWLTSHAGNIFNVKSVQISGSLNDAANKKPFMAHVQGTFADAAIDVSVQFTPGQAEDFVKGLVMHFIDDAKADLKKYIHI